MSGLYTPTVTAPVLGYGVSSDWNRPDARGNGREKPMPTANPDKLQATAEALKQQLKERGESMEGAERRALGKRVRRLQRKRRRILAGQQATQAPASAESAEEEKKEA